MLESPERRRTPLSSSGATGAKQSSFLRYKKDVKYGSAAAALDCRAFCSKLGLEQGNLSSV